MGDGNTTFTSISPDRDPSRAPTGKRTVTITTHTKLGPWWALLARDREAYAFRRASHRDRLLAAAEVAVPGVRRALDVCFAGTHGTYPFYTGRARGWVGGIPQTSLTRSFSPELAPGLRTVGDSIFIGQSTLAVVLSSLRAGCSLLDQLGLEVPALAS